MRTHKMDDIIYSTLILTIGAVCCATIIAESIQSGRNRQTISEVIRAIATLNAKDSNSKKA